MPCGTRTIAETVVCNLKMNKIGQAKSTNRDVYYISTKTDNWTNFLPTNNWLALPICDHRDTELLDKVAHSCLDNNVTYICTVGQECELTHDWFDETILERRIKSGQPVDTPDDFEDEPMTTWHNDFEEGFWFALTSAYEGDKEINKVVCIDLTNSNHKEKLNSLLTRINKGWLPSN
jgi:hypothetical protein